ncbi:hypothetical protein [Longimicrobium sp.]|uniref:hypothetical protein n=1 Tax=Longimicrobium sp. TaxID=2029185 RepID=UPI003B3B8E5B
MRSQLYDAVREATRDEFDLVAELGAGDAWAVFLGRAVEGSGLALLLLQEAEEGGEFELEVIHAVEGGLPVGRTACAACGAGEAGWPRWCAGCGADLSGMQANAAVAGESAAELLQEVRDAADGVFQVVGAMPHAEGGGALYFAREHATDHIVGLTLREEADGELSLAVSWTADAEAAETSSPVVIPEPVVSAVPVPSMAPDASTVVPPPLWDPPSAPSRARARVNGRRIAGAAAVAGIGVALVIALVLFVGDPPLAESTDVGQTTMVPGPVVDAGAPADTATVGAPVETGTPPAGGGSTVSTVSTVSTQAAERTKAPETIRPVVETAVSTAEEAEPARVEPPAAPTAAGVEAAVRQYAQAVGSCQTSRVSRAYPGITEAEVLRWERFFRQNCGGGVRAGFVAEAPASVDGTRAELLFTLTLAYTDGTGRTVEQPLPLRAVLEWRAGAWSLREVRSLAG